MMLSIALMFVAAPNAPTTCDYDLDAMIQLTQMEFDQDENGGWRPLALKGCYAEAAELIAKWRAAQGVSDTTLNWHEGQMRASAGQYERASALFDASRHPEEEGGKWGWNLYVDASIAFLKGDKAALLLSRERLSKLPEPPELKTLTDAHGNPSNVEWPMNLRVVDALIRCWGKSYRDAYSCPA